MNEKIKVFHLEDYKIIRDAIRLLLREDSEIEIVAQGSHPEDLFYHLQGNKIDVVILDIYPGGAGANKTLNGFEICARIRREFPLVRIVTHSIYDDADTVAKILRAGASGFVSKKIGFEELFRAIKAVSNGGIFICQETSRRLRNLQEFLSGVENKLRNKEEIFSMRQREVLELIGKGKKSREISEEMFITQRTVETHRKNMIKKANVKNTAELIVYASSVGILKH